MKTKPNEPINLSGKGFYNDEFSRIHSGIGLTKREYFASMAMQGIAQHYSKGQDTALAEKAIKFADALIKELNKVSE